MANNIKTNMSAEALTEVSGHNATNHDNIVGTASATIATTGDNRNNLNINQTPPHHANPNDTISAAADSSDNQADVTSQTQINDGNGNVVHNATTTSTLNDHHMSVEQQQQQQQQQKSFNNNQSHIHSHSQSHHPAFMSSMYGRSVPPSLYSSGLYKTMPPMHINSQAVLQQQPPHSIQQHHQQQHQHHQQQQGTTTYTSYLNSYQQFYQEQQLQQQQQQQQHHQQQQSVQNLEPLNYLGSTATSGAPTTSTPNVNDFYCHSSGDAEAAADVGSANNFSNSKISSDSLRYHPYNITSTISTHSAENQRMAASSSPRVVTSTSPLSINNHTNASNLANSISGDNDVNAGGGSSGITNSNSSSSKSNFTCTKCGFICNTDIALQDHIKFIHTSPYQHHHRTYNPDVNVTNANTAVMGSIDQTQRPNLETAQHDISGGISGRNTTTSNMNPGEILDLDSRKLLYPPAANTSLSNNTSHSLYAMQSTQPSPNITNWNQQVQQQEQQQQQTTNNNLLPSYITTQQQVSTTDTKPPIINQPNSPFNQSPKQSPFSGASSIKSEYSGIGMNAQQNIMGTPVVSSSPAEFPSTTTTDGIQDGQQHSLNQEGQQALSQQQQQQQRQLKTSQQYRNKNGTNGNTNSSAINFEAPTSSSAMSTSQSGTTKPANWKSNEPRRPKTYNCTACNKWFTSSGHLKRHYNTTLHKNAVKQSGKPDPCTLPISQFHHPSRDPNYKSNRRGNGSISQRHQQQPPTSSMQQLPETPTQLGSNLNNITPVNSFENASPPSANYNNTVASTHHYLQQQQQQQQQVQYLPQCQTTTIATPVPSVTTTDNSMESTMPYAQNEVAINGHPNGLAGLSVQTTTPMPYSPVRGLLKSTSTTTAIPTPSNITVKKEREAATPMEEQPHISRIPFMEVMQAETELPIVEPKAEDEEEQSITMKTTETITTTNGQVWVWQQDLTDPYVQLRQLPTVPPLELDQVVKHHSPQLLDLDLVQVVEEDNYNLQHIPPHNMHKTMHTPPIIYQDPEVLPQEAQLLEPVNHISSHMLQQQLQQLPNMAEVQQQPPCPPPTPLDINMQPNSTLLQQQPATTIHIHTPTHTINMDNMLLNLAPLMEIQPLTTNITTIHPLDININTHQVLQQSQHTTHSNNSITPILPQLDSLHPQRQADPIPTSPRTTIGSNDFDHQPEESSVITTLTPPKNPPILLTKSIVYGYGKGGSNIRQISPRQGDLPPEVVTQYHLLDENAINITANSTRITSPATEDFAKQEEQHDDKENIKIVYEQQNYHYEPQSINNKATSNSNNKRTPRRLDKSTGPHVCLICNKAFFNQCYLTQHNDKIHSGKYEYRCKHCGKGYNDLTKFDNHVKCHTNPDKKHKCTLCTKQYNHKSDLTRHIAVCHEKAKNQDKLHYCDICGKDFIRRDQLRTHIKSHLRRSRKEKNARERGGSGRNSAITNTITKDNKSSKVEQIEVLKI